jgi:thioredoxin-related protein
VSVRWLTFEEATERSKADKRKIFIEVYTDWCGWCKRLDAVTFTDSAVAQYLNENYYPVKFNAESSEEIVFHQKTYALRRQGGRSYHELAVELLNGRLSFPTLVFLDENLNVIQAIAGYQEPDKLFTILNYFGTDSHKTTPWDVYERRFNQQH